MFFLCCGKISKKCWTIKAASQYQTLSSADDKKKWPHIMYKDIFNYCVITWCGWVYTAKMQMFRGVSVTPQWKSWQDFDQWQYWWPGIHKDWCPAKPKQVWCSLYTDSHYINWHYWDGQVLLCRRGSCSHAVASLWKIG